MKNQIRFFLLILLYTGLLYGQNCFVFIGSYNSDKTKEGIYVYAFDTTTGNLTKVASVSNILNPSFLTLSGNGKFLYACTDTRTPGMGSVSSYAFDPSAKTLTYINTQKTGGENPVYVSLPKSGRWLVNANYTDGSVSAYPINKDGSIAPVSQFISYTDSSINKARQEHAHIHATVFSPAEDYLFLPDLGSDKIRCYKFDSLQLLQPLQPASVPFIAVVAGSGPRHLTFHPNGKFAYCIEELSGTVSAYKYSNGKLDSIQRIAAHIKRDTGIFSSADIHISPDGKYLYASNRGDENNIAVFSINEDGMLKHVSYQSTFGKTPRNFTLDLTGKFVIAANQSSGNLVVFKRNRKTGKLKKTGVQVKVESPGCVQIRYYP